MDDATLRERVETENLGSPGQLELINNDIANLERALSGRPMGYYGGDAGAAGHMPEMPMMPTANESYHMPIPEPELLREALRKDILTRNSMVPEEMSGFTKDKLWAWYKEEKAKYREGLLSEKQMWEATHANIQAHIRHQDHNKQRGKLLMNIHRRLNPGDDTFNLEDLRPSKPIEINSELFRRHHDEIKWTAEKERELRRRDLDDDTYLQFLQLRAANINTPKLIQQKLHIDQGLYEACVDRLVEAQGRYRGTDEETDAPTPIEGAETLPAEPDTTLTELQAKAFDEWGEDANTMLIQAPTTGLFPRDLMEKFSVDQHKARSILNALAKLGRAVRKTDGSYHAAD